MPVTTSRRSHPVDDAGARAAPGGRALREDHGRLRPGRRGALRRWGTLALGLAALLAVCWWVSRSPIFALHSLSVRGNVHHAPQDVARLAGLSPDTNVLWLSADRVERRLEADPWIADARVARVLPSTLAVTIRERAAVAVLAPGELLVAADGTLLGPAAPGTRLPRLLGGSVPASPGSAVRSDLPQLTVAVAMPRGLAGRVQQVVRDPDGTIRLRTRDGITVLFGTEGEAEPKWDALAAVLSWSRRHEVRPMYVDVRVPAAPSIRPAGEPADPAGA